ncbi:MAG: outer membrane lipid asymmetry maintenance protein MlaD [Humidesulfovibrio sp.]|jgi:phospholipid/cholesterol/gamma-HCH transport system substrate-binding protein|nr:outer membrane lipid asymmetry maintenance protein MlaD [Humidesulfovibrio sp.]PKN07792.1 MAG: outer membrane lipid asymmetry maintenance protein MlaD [Deltaproteobacteria bacterium HGW-Deltaproteobacteria-8]
MKKYSKETQVGIFVLLGFFAIAYMSIKLGNVHLFSDNFYPIVAKFNDVTGLKLNAPVQMYGVEMGFVENIGIDLDTGMSSVTLRIRKDIKLTDDTIASVKTSGLIGDKYIKLSRGGGDPIKAGAVLRDTESSIDLEELISKYVFGGV